MKLINSIEKRRGRYELILLNECSESQCEEMLDILHSGIKVEFVGHINDYDSQYFKFIHKDVTYILWFSFDYGLRLCLEDDEIRDDREYELLLKFRQLLEG